MLLGGVHTLTLLDYPGKVACIVFTAGCNMRCGYCHNPEMVLPQLIRCRKDFIPSETFFHFLETRKNFLEGVVVSGGEPTIHPGMIDFIKKIKEKGFLVKLDTNGSNPDVLKSLIDQKLVDYVAMDVKTTPPKYEKLTVLNGIWNKVQKSYEILLASPVDFEVRTTFIKGYHTFGDTEKMAHFFKEAPRYEVQNFRPQKTLDPAFGKYKSFTPQELEAIRQKINSYRRKKTSVVL